MAVSVLLPSFKVELPSPSREIGTLVLVISSSLLAFLGQIPYIYIYNLYFVLRDFVTKHPKIPESHIVAVFHVPRGHGQDPPFLRFLLFS